MIGLTKGGSSKVVKALELHPKVLTAKQLTVDSAQWTVHNPYGRCRVKDGYEISVRQRWVILCKWVGRGGAFVDLKDLKAHVAADLGGFETFRLLSSSFLR